MRLFVFRLLVGRRYFGDAGRLRRSERVRVRSLGQRRQGDHVSLLERHLPREYISRRKVQLHLFGVPPHEDGEAGPAQTEHWRR